MAGQFCILLPDQNAVVVMTANTRDMGAELNLVSDKLLPAFHDDPLPENSANQTNLKAVSTNLKASR